MNAAPMVYHCMWHQSLLREFHECPLHPEHTLTAFGGLLYHCSEGHLVDFRDAIPPRPEPRILAALHG